MKDNQKLKRIFAQDQHERKYFKKYQSVMGKNDKKRRSETKKIIDKNLLKTATDYFMAGMIFQHGDKPEDYIFTQKLALKSAKLGEEQGKWLYAASTDRLLVNQGKKQKYGTQYHGVVIKDKKTGKEKMKMKLYPIDKRTTDKLRTEYNVPPLKQLQAREKEFTDKYFGKSEK